MEAEGAGVGAAPVSALVQATAWHQAVAEAAPTATASDSMTSAFDLANVLRQYDPRR